jgi:hypothetical protein
VENCNHKLVRVKECTKCGKTFDTIPPSADWEVLEKLEADTLRFMVVDLQNGIERRDVDQIKKVYRKLGDVQKRDIDEWVQEAINGIEGMRGINDDAASPIHSELNGIFVFLRELQDAGWFAEDD